jgi:hypothetical protein
VPKPSITPATRLADHIMAQLSYLDTGAKEALAWYTKAEMRAWFEGYGSGVRARRDAVIRVLERTVFADDIEAGRMARYRPEATDQAA